MMCPICGKKLSVYGVCTHCDTQAYQRAKQAAYRERHPEGAKECMMRYRARHREELARRRNTPEQKARKHALNLAYRTRAKAKAQENEAVSPRAKRQKKPERPKGGRSRAEYQHWYYEQVTKPKRQRQRDS